MAYSAISPVKSEDCLLQARPPNFSMDLRASNPNPIINPVTLSVTDVRPSTSGEDRRNSGIPAVTNTAEDRPLTYLGEGCSKKLPPSLPRDGSDIDTDDEDDESTPLVRDSATKGRVSLASSEDTDEESQAASSSKGSHVQSSLDIVEATRRVLCKPLMNVLSGRLPLLDRLRRRKKKAEVVPAIYDVSRSGCVGRGFLSRSGDNCLTLCVRETRTKNLHSVRPSYVSNPNVEVINGTDDPTKGARYDLLTARLLAHQRQRDIRSTDCVVRGLASEFYRQNPTALADDAVIDLRLQLDESERKPEFQLDCVVESSDLGLIHREFCAFTTIDNQRSPNFFSSNKNLFFKQLLIADVMYGRIGVGSLNKRQGDLSLVYLHNASIRDVSIYGCHTDIACSSKDLLRPSHLAIEAATSQVKKVDFKRLITADCKSAGRCMASVSYVDSSLTTSDFCDVMDKHSSIVGYCIMPFSPLFFVSRISSGNLTSIDTVWRKTNINGVSCVMLSDSSVASRPEFILFSDLADYVGKQFHMSSRGKIYTSSVDAFKSDHVIVKFEAAVFCPRLSIDYDVEIRGACAFGMKTIVVPELLCVCDDPDKLSAVINGNKYSYRSVTLDGGFLNDVVAKVGNMKNFVLAGANRIVSTADRNMYDPTTNTYVHKKARFSIEESSAIAMYAYVKNYQEKYNDSKILSTLLVQTEKDRNGVSGWDTFKALLCKITGRTPTEQGALTTDIKGLFTPSSLMRATVAYVLTTRMMCAVVPDVVAVIRNKATIHPLGVSNKLTIQPISSSTLPEVEVYPDAVVVAVAKTESSINTAVTSGVNVARRSINARPVNCDFKGIATDNASSNNDCVYAAVLTAEDKVVTVETIEVYRRKLLNHLAKQNNEIATASMPAVRDKEKLTTEHISELASAIGVNICCHGPGIEYHVSDEAKTVHIKLDDEHAVALVYDTVIPDAIPTSGDESTIEMIKAACGRPEVVGTLKARLSDGTSITRLKRLLNSVEFVVTNRRVEALTAIDRNVRFVSSDLSVTSTTHIKPICSALVKDDDRSTANWIEVIGCDTVIDTTLSDAPISSLTEGHSGLIPIVTTAMAIGRGSNLFVRCHSLLDKKYATIPVVAELFENMTVHQIDDYDKVVGACYVEFSNRMPMNCHEKYTQIVNHTAESYDAYTKGVDPTNEVFKHVCDIASSMSHLITAVSSTKLDKLPLSNESYKKVCDDAKPIRQWDTVEKFLKLKAGEVNGFVLSDEADSLLEKLRESGTPAFDTEWNGADDEPIDNLLREFIKDEHTVRANALERNARKLAPSTTRVYDALVTFAAEAGVGYDVIIDFNVDELKLLRKGGTFVYVGRHFEKPPTQLAEFESYKFLIDPRSPRGSGNYIVACVGHKVGLRSRDQLFSLYEYHLTSDAKHSYTNELFGPVFLRENFGLPMSDDGAGSSFIIRGSTIDNTVCMNQIGKERAFTGYCSDVDYELNITYDNIVPRFTVSAMKVVIACKGKKGEQSDEMLRALIALVFKEGTSFSCGDVENPESLFLFGEVDCIMMNIFIDDLTPMRNKANSRMPSIKLADYLPKNFPTKDAATNSVMEAVAYHRQQHAIATATLMQYESALDGQSVNYRTIGKAADSIPELAGKVVALQGLIDKTVGFVSRSGKILYSPPGLQRPSVVFARGNFYRVSEGKDSHHLKLPERAFLDKGNAYFVFSERCTVFNDEDIALKLETRIAKARFPPLTHLTRINGGPGCGKTSAATRAIDDTVLFLTNTTITRDTVAEKLREKDPNKEIRNVMTYDSYIMHKMSQVRFKTVIMDENYTQHDGKLVAIMSAFPETVDFKLMGDIKQLPAINRTSSLGAWKFDRAISSYCKEVIPVSVSRRFPCDIAALNNDLYKDIGGLYTCVQESHSLELVPAKNYFDMVNLILRIRPTKVLCFYRDEKSQLINSLKSLYPNALSDKTICTVGECQGDTVESSVIILNKTMKSTKAVHDNPEQMNVATTRHTKKCTIIYNSAFNDYQLVKRVKVITALKKKGDDFSSFRKPAVDVLDLLVKKYGALKPGGVSLLPPSVIANSFAQPKKPLDLRIPELKGFKDRQGPPTVTSRSHYWGRMAKVPAYDDLSAIATTRMKRASAVLDLSAITSDDHGPGCLEKYDLSGKIPRKSAHADFRREPIRRNRTPNAPVREKKRHDLGEFHKIATGRVTTHATGEVMNNDVVDSYLNYTTIRPLTVDEFVKKSLQLRKVRIEEKFVSFILLDKLKAAAPSLRAKGCKIYFSGANESVDPNRVEAVMQTEGFDNLCDVYFIREEEVEIESHPLEDDVDDELVSTQMVQDAIDDNFPSNLFDQRDALGVFLDSEISTPVFKGTQPSICYDRPESEFEKMVPVLRTPVQLPVPVNIRTVDVSIAKRNMVQESMNVTLPKLSLSTELVDKFFSTYMKMDRFPVMQFDLQSQLDWLARQDSDVMSQVEELQTRIRDDTIYSLLLKPNAKPELDANTPAGFVVPQVIAAANKLLNFIYGQFVMKCMQRVTAFLQPNTLMYTNMSVEEFEKRLDRQLPLRQYNKLEMDISRFDKSQEVTALMFEVELMRRLGVPERFCVRWMSIHMDTTLESRETGVKFRLGAQRRSGDSTTFFGNTTFLMAMVAMCAPVENAAMCMFAGDDSLILDPPPYGDISSMMSDTFNMEMKIFDKPGYAFCSKYIIPTFGGWKFVPDPVKMVIKLGRHDIPNPDNVEKLRVSLCDLCTNFDKVEVQHSLQCVNIRHHTNFDIPMLCRFIHQVVYDPSKFKSLFELPAGKICLDPSSRFRDI